MDKKTGRAGTPNTKHDGVKPSEVKQDASKPSGKNRQKRTKSDAKEKPDTEPETVVDFPSGDPAGESCGASEPEAEPAEERIRPGVSNETLDDLGIRPVEGEEAHGLCGIRASGLWIPYPETGGYGRLRLDNATPDQKYHQAKGSTVHAYMTPELGEAAADPQSGAEVAVVEGEFKSLALSEVGIPAVGLGGFYGFKRRDRRMVPALKAMLDRIKPRAIYFCGDADTSLNEQFADAALQLAALVDCPVLLPRLHLDEPKGWDDVREAFDLDDERFLERWQEAVDEAVAVDTGKTTAKLAVELLRPEQEPLRAGKDGGLGEWKAKERLAAIGAMAKRESDALMDEVADLVVEAKLFRRSSFKSEVNKLTESRKESAKEKGGEEEFTPEMADSLAERFVYDGSVFYERSPTGDRYNSIRLRPDMLMRLHELGAPKAVPEGKLISPAEEVYSRIQRERRVEYAGPLGGRAAGVYEEDGKLVLATNSPKFVEASKEDCHDSPLMGVVAGLLREEHEQLATFIGWLQRARTAMRNPKQHLPGQGLVLVGPPDCGKSLLQEILSWCLGGREEDISAILDGRDATFTGAIFRAEHLVASDTGMSGSTNAQKSFRDQLKKLVANPKQACRVMRQEQITMRPIFRITVSTNDDPDSCDMIPNPVEDPSLKDKVIMFACRRPDVLPDADTCEEGRQRFMQGLRDDLPNFLRYVDEYEVPADLRKARFGIREFVHPSIVQLLESQDRDAESIKWISSYLGSLQSGVFEGTADELLSRVREYSQGEIDTRSPKRISHVVQRMASKTRWQGKISWEHGRSKDRNPALVFRVEY